VILSAAWFRKVVVIISSASLSSVWNGAWPIILSILFFGFIIFIHELGHFTFAKIFKVKVNEFSIGMGPALFKKKTSETLYCLRALPIGGYVAMEDEQTDGAKGGTFDSKPVYQRALILCAGGFMNLLLGFILLCIILSQGLIGTPVISQFSSGASSHKTGLEQGDRIIAVNGNKIYTQTDLSFFVMNDKDGIMDMTVLRDGKTKVLRSVKFASYKKNGSTVIKYDFSIIGVKPNFSNIMKYSFLETGSMARIVLVSLKDLITFNLDLSELSGPVGIVGLMSDTAKASESTADYSGLFTIQALITINLGVFNLLPLPALDGGKLFFVLLEGITRKKASKKLLQSFDAAGFALLLVLMIIVTFNDIGNLIK
jgi:regulator of sigma E protease